jgi:hypothetical protein
MLTLERAVEAALVRLPVQSGSRTILRIGVENLGPRCADDSMSSSLRTCFNPLLIRALGRLADAMAASRVSIRSLRMRGTQPFACRCWRRLTQSR